ncbi:MAG: hypothetical protein Q8L66_07705 [Caulobacter sp.]|nr:hypothetical protein [Caulobacter sp.]
MFNTYAFETLADGRRQRLTGVDGLLIMTGAIFAGGFALGMAIVLLAAAA